MRQVFPLALGDVLGRDRRVALASFILIVALIVGTAAVPAAAQTDAGALRVLVSDQSEAVVPGATVEVINAATNALVTRVSDEDGYAQLAPLPRGIYSVRVTLSGFQTVEVSNVRVDVNERRFLTLTLNVAAAAETVEVVSRAAVIQTEEGSLGQVIKGEVAVELPRSHTAIVWCDADSSAGR